MRRFIIILFFCTLFLMGCEKGGTNDNDVSRSQNASKNIIINYEGTSRNWAASYKIDGNEKSHDSYYTIKYAGVDGSTVKEVNYIIDGPKEGESGKFTFESTKEYTGKMKITGGLPSSNDRGINVKLKWNGNIELLLLRRSK